MVWNWVLNVFEPKGSIAWNGRTHEAQSTGCRLLRVTAYRGWQTSMEPFDERSLREVESRWRPRGVGSPRFQSRYSIPRLISTGWLAVSFVIGPNSCYASTPAIPSVPSWITRERMRCGTRVDIPFALRAMLLVCPYSHVSVVECSTRCWPCELGIYDMYLTNWCSFCGTSIIWRQAASFRFASPDFVD